MQKWLCMTSKAESEKVTQLLSCSLAHSCLEIWAAIEKVLLPLDHYAGEATVDSLADSPVRSQQIGSNSLSCEWGVLDIKPRQSLRWLQSQPTSDCNHLRHPKQELPRWVLLKFMTHKIMTKQKIVVLIQKFLG